MKDNAAAGLAITGGMLSLVWYSLPASTIGVRWVQERSADNSCFSYLVNNQQLTLDRATLAQFNAAPSRPEHPAAGAMPIGISSNA